MAEYVTKIRTEDGDKQIDYNALANLPTIDASLSMSGQLADAKVTGDAITNINEWLDELDADMDYIYSIHYELEDSLMPTNHAAPDTTYGIGTEENYGHVKLYDDNVLADNTSTQESLQGVAATPFSLKMGLDSVIGDTSRQVESLQDQIATKAPTTHTSVIGSSTGLGHVRLSDEPSALQTALQGGVAATPKAVDTVDKKIITLQRGLYATKTTTTTELVTVNITSGTDYKTYNCFTASKSGLYIIEAAVSYHYNGTGTRHAQFSTQLGGIKVPACNSNNMQTQMYISQCVYLEEGETVQIKLQQNSGNTLGCEFKTRYTCIPIPDSYANPREPGIM